MILIFVPDGIPYSQWKQFDLKTHASIKLAYNDLVMIIQVILCTDGLANRGIGNLDGKGH